MNNSRNERFKNNLGLIILIATSIFFDIGILSMDLKFSKPWS